MDYDGLQTYDVIYEWWDNLENAWVPCITTMDAMQAHDLGRILELGYNQYHQIRPISISFAGVCLMSWDYQLEDVHNGKQAEKN